MLVYSDGVVVEMVVVGALRALTNQRATLLDEFLRLKVPSQVEHLPCGQS